MKLFHAQFVAVTEIENHGECLTDYMDCHSPGRGFESRRAGHIGP